MDSILATQHRETMQRGNVNLAIYTAGVQKLCIVVVLHIVCVITSILLWSNWKADCTRDTTANTQNNMLNNHV